MILILCFVFLFGIAVGSFLNVVIYRYNTGAAIANDRSICFSCSKRLSWYELLPIASFLIQGGKCRGCKSRISWQYPIVELSTGLIFVFLARMFPPITVALAFQFLFHALIWSILIVIVVYDLRHKIIPDMLVFSFAGLSFVRLFMSVSETAIGLKSAPLSFIIAGPALFLPFFLLWFISRGAWIGLGDGKLALGIGWLLGPVYGTSAIVLAFWLGAAVGVTLIILKALLKKSVFHRIALSFGITNRIMKSEMPFAPFLILGIFITFFLQFDVTGLSAFI